MKKINKVLLLTALAAVGTGALSSCSFINNSQNKEKVSYVNVNINPDLELIVDSDNKVVKVIGSNQDARVLLYGEANLEGLDIEVAIDKIVDGDVYKHVKDLISEAEEIQGKMDDAEDAIQDIENQIQELENIWRDTYVDFEERVLDALVKSYQDVIDNYSELNDTLNNSNSEILDAI